VNTCMSVQRAAAVSLLTGVAVLAAGPAHAGPNPEAPAVVGGHQSRVAVDGHLAAGPAVPSGVSPNVRSRLEVMERASQGRWAVREEPATGTQDSDPSSVPLLMLTLLSGGLVTGAAGYTVYRFRHHGPVEAATA
jgi:hypothetical protein